MKKSNNTSNTKSKTTTPALAFVSNQDFKKFYKSCSSLPIEDEPCEGEYIFAPGILIK